MILPCARRRKKAAQEDLEESELMVCWVPSLYCQYTRGFFCPIMFLYSWLFLPNLSVKIVFISEFPCHIKFVVLLSFETILLQESHL
jgi:hypothetical protein